MNAGAIAQLSTCTCSARQRAGAGMLLLALSVSPGIATGDTDVEQQQRGEYVFRIAGCGGCHTAKEEGAVPLAGGRRLETPFGTFLSPNITSHPEHGIGGWRVEDLSRALRSGESPGGVHLYPAFPYTSYAGMMDEDIRALVAYLERVPPVDTVNQPHELPWYLRSRAVLYFWKLLFHSPEAFAPRAGQSADWNRGAYLVNVIGHCGECHPPRNVFGAFDRGKHLGGNPDGPDGEAVPNITTHPETGIGNWSDGEIREYLKSGLLPDGDVAGGTMAAVIEESLGYLRDGDIDAIVTYLKTVPPIAD